jgi:hypothetical protein
MQSEEWILRYVHEAGRAVPSAQREQLEGEVRRMVDDALQEAGIDDLATADEAAVLDVLQQLGRPEQVAARLASRYLIGPELYPVFRTVLGIVMLVMVGISIFGAGVSVGLHGARLEMGIIVGNLASGMLQTLGMVVLVFGLIEYFSGRRAPRDEAPWHPEKLPGAGDLDAVKRGGTIADIIFTLAALVIFNLFLVSDGALVLRNGEWETVPIFADGFLTVIPILTVLWVAEIVLKSYVLVRGRWVVATRAMELILSLSGIAILLRMLTTPSLAANPTLEPFYKVVIAVVIAVAAVDVMMQGFRLYGQYRREHSAPPAQEYPVG